MNAMVARHAAECLAAVRWDSDRERDGALAVLEHGIAVDVLGWTVDFADCGHQTVCRWTPPDRPAFVGDPPWWTRSQDAATQLVEQLIGPHQPHWCLRLDGWYSVPEPLWRATIMWPSREITGAYRPLAGLAICHAALKAAYSLLAE